MKNFKALLVPVGLVALVVGIFSFTNHNDGDDDKCKIKIIKIVNGVKTEVDSTFDCSDKMSWISSLGSEGDSLHKMIKMMMVEGGDSNSFSFDIDIETDDENVMKFKDDNGEEMEMHFDMKMLDGEDGVMKMMINGKEMEIKLGDMSKQLEKLHEHIEVIDTESGNVEIRIDSDEDGGESQTIQIMKTIDDDGNVIVKKTVNGEEVEFNEEDMKSMPGGHKMIFISDDGKTSKMEGNHEVMIDVNVEGEDGKEVRKMVIISKIITSEKSSKDLPASVDLDKKELAVNKLRFSPNPNNGIFDLNFKLKEEKPVQVKIVDMQGKEVYIENVKNFTGKYANKIDISENGEGIYILQILQGDKASTSKIVIK